MDNESRTFDRFQARFPAKFKDALGGFGNNVILRDVSATGLNIQAKDRLFLNDPIALEVELPDGNDPLDLSSRVMWSKPANEPRMWDIGLRFDRVDFIKIQRVLKYTKL